MRETHKRPGLMPVITIMTVLYPTAQPAAADVAYDSLSLFTPPQAAFDLAQSRPGLTLNRGAAGAINSSGQLTGKGDAGTNQLNQNIRPFFYDPAEHTAANLGDLTGDFADPSVTPRNDASQGKGINDAGWVVGVSSTGTTAGIVDDRPFLWIDDDGNHAHTPGEMHELALNPGAGYGSALRINNTGQSLITGDTGLYRAGLELSAGVVSEPAPRTLIAPATEFADLNDAGNVAYTLGNAGFVWRDMNTDHLADPGEITQVPFMSAAAPNSSVFAINNAGQVVGTMRNEHARDIGYIWTDLNGDNRFDFADTNNNGIFEWDETSEEVVRFHGDPAGINATAGNTFVLDINDQGQAVGAFVGSANRNALLFDPAQGLRFLNDLIDPLFPAQLRRADAINNRGQIAAFGREVGSSIDKLVLLTPIAPDLAGDLNADGFVGIADLNLVLGAWNQNVTPGELLLGDPSGDGFVGIADLNVVLGNWNAGVPPGIPGESPGANTNVAEPGVVGLVGATGLWLTCVRPRRLVS